MSRSLRIYAVPLVLLLLVTVPHLEQGDFRRDTGRYAAVGHYMWSDGSLLLPHLNPDTPYFNKPPLALWIHGLSLKLFGRNLIAARAPSILAALGTVCFTMLAVRRLSTRAEAVTAGIVLALTYEFFRRTREISLDFWQVCFMMMAVWLAVLSLRGRSAGWLVLAGIPLGLSLLCKPLVALGVIPIIGLWAGLSRQWRLLLPLLLGTLPLTLAVAAPWHLMVYHHYGAAFTDQYFGRQIGDRARGLIMRAPWYYYFAGGLSLYLPWMLAVGYAVYLRVRHGTPRPPQRDLLKLGGVWVILVLLGLSLFPDKKPNYALPLYPMLAWMAAYGLCRMPFKQWRQWYASGFRWLTPSAVALGVMLSLLPIRFQSPPGKDWESLLAWVDRHPAMRLSASPDLDADQLCYYYIRRGAWLPQAGTVEPQEDCVLAMAREVPGARSSDVLLASGSLRLVRPQAMGPATRRAPSASRQPR